MVVAKDFLHSDKKIYDSLHGFIAFDEFEKELIDSLPFQRLHYIHQLGIAYLVYPGATHTRFEHSIGVMELATRMFDKICKSVRPDVFPLVPRKGSSEYLYWRRVLRMAALCHDLGHLPFSHVAEKELLGEEGHEFWTLKIIESPHLAPVWDKLKKVPTYFEDLVERDIVEDIQKIAVGEKKWKEIKGTSFTPWERIISEIITGDFFGADRIDFLLRDAKSTGVSFGLFDYHQLIEMLRVLPSPDEEDMELRLGIDANGLEACEALLLARHFMHRRIYQYSSVKAYNFHLRRFMQTRLPQKIKTVEEFLSMSDVDVIALLHEAAKNPKLPGHRDAACIILRKQRFRAMALPEKITEKDVKDFKTSRKLSDEEMAWEFVSSLGSSQKPSFPVSKRHMIVQKAEECSDLLPKISSKTFNWLYIAPEHDFEFVSFLEGRMR